VCVSTSLLVFVVLLVVAYLAHLVYLVVKKQRNLLPLSMYAFCVFLCGVRVVYMFMAFEVWVDIYLADYGPTLQIFLDLLPELLMLCIYILLIVAWGEVAWRARALTQSRTLTQRRVGMIAALNILLLMLAFLIFLVVIYATDRSYTKAVSDARFLLLALMIYVMLLCVLTGALLVWQLRRMKIMSESLQKVHSSCGCVLFGRAREREPHWPSSCGGVPMLLVLCDWKVLTHVVCVCVCVCVYSLVAHALSLSLFLFPSLSLSRSLSRSLWYSLAFSGILLNSRARS
jgi:hypothetical protein